jgi:hypothetical protein
MSSDVQGSRSQLGVTFALLAPAAALLLASLAALTLIDFLGDSPALGEARAYRAAYGAVGGIPPLYLELYVAAARRYSLDWTVLAGIGKLECDHGRDPDPSCTQEGVVNAAGAGGPAQFLAATWRTYGVDGNGDGVADRWNPADAIFSMAAYMRAAGAPGDYRRALFSYNHARWYVEEVQRWASTYRAAAAGEVVAGQAAFAGADAGGQAVFAGYPQESATSTVFAAAATIELVPGARALLSPTDGHLALIPAQAPPVVQAMVIAGNELQDLPYGPAGHPDPRGALSEDCSSTLNYVLYRSGVRSIDEILRQNPLAQDYLSWGDPGPGRWVSIYATAAPTAHVFVVIAGLRLDTSHDGTDVGPNRDEDGPRWRVLDHIPTWAHWTVRHPRGL